MTVPELITQAAIDFEIPPIIFTSYRRKFLTGAEVISMINEMYELILERPVRVDKMTPDDLALLSLETKNALEAQGIRGNYYTPPQVSPKWILLSRMYEASPWRLRLGELSQFSNPVQDEILLGIEAKIDLTHALIPGISAVKMQAYRLRAQAYKENKDG